jgi:DNA-directed RNA polymerase delta subunit
VTAPALAIRELEAHGDFLGTHELLEILQRYGYKPKGKSTPYDSLYASLWHAANKDGNRVVNRDAKWGLREWLEPGWTPRQKEVGS